MDPQIEELKQLIRQNIALTQENNKMLRSIRNAGRIKSLMFAILVAASIGLSLYSYFYFIEPKINELKSTYQQNVGPIQDIWNKLQGFMNTTPSTTPTAQ